MRCLVALALLAVAACSHPPSDLSAEEPAPGTVMAPQSLFAEPVHAPDGEGLDNAGAVQPTAEPSATAVGAVTLSIMGTPIFAMLKAAMCVSSVALAAPLAALSELAQDRHKDRFRQSLHDGVDNNCGGSYMIGS